MKNVNSNPLKIEQNDYIPLDGCNGECGEHEEIFKPFEYEKYYDSLTIEEFDNTLFHEPDEEMRSQLENNNPPMFVEEMQLEDNRYYAAHDFALDNGIVFSQGDNDMYDSDDEKCAQCFD